MKPSRGNHLEAFYACALRCYPRAFRERNHQAMSRAFNDALLDGSLSSRELILLMLRDLATSLPKEHLAMLRETFARPALLMNAAILAALSTGLALALFAIPQHLLRSGANDPQIAMAGDLTQTLEHGAAPGQAVTPANIDMAVSLSPFVIVYDDQGHPLASQAQLQGQVPVLPRGVFDYVRTHGEERLSWQPVLGGERGVRIAAVVERVQHLNGSSGGFVLAGRNLREVETRIGQVTQMAQLTWFGMLAVILTGTATFAWWTRPAAK